VPFKMKVMMIRHFGMITLGKGMKSFFLYHLQLVVLVFPLECHACIEIKGSFSYLTFWAYSVVYDSLQLQLHLK
jgi:hypothetical protein